MQCGVQFRQGRGLHRSMGVMRLRFKRRRTREAQHKSGRGHNGQLGCAVADAAGLGAKAEEFETRRGLGCKSTQQDNIYPVSPSCMEIGTLAKPS